MFVSNVHAFFVHDSTTCQSTMQKSFSDLEYAAKKKLTRCDRFFAKIDEVTPWSQLHQLIEPFYPKAESAGRPAVGTAHCTCS